MALWLELIPKIHKPDTFDPNLHLLDDPRNESSFEPVGTRSLDSPLSPWAPDWRDDFAEAEDLEGTLPEEIEDEKLDSNRGLVLQTYPDNDPGRVLASKTQGRKIPGDSSTRPKKLPTANGELDGELDASGNQMSGKEKISDPKKSTQDKYSELLDQGGDSATGPKSQSSMPGQQIINPNSKSNQQPEPDRRLSSDFDKQSGQSSTLTLTVSVGCALLLLNCVVFAATFCQWHRFGRTARSRGPEAEMLKDKMAIATTSGCIQETEFYGRGVHPSFFHPKDMNQQHPYRQCISSSPSAAMAAVSIATTTTTIDSESPYKYNNHHVPPTHMKPPPRSTPLQAAVLMTSSSHVTDNHVTSADHQDRANFDESQQTSSRSTTIV